MALRGRKECPELSFSRVFNKKGRRNLSTRPGRPASSGRPPTPTFLIWLFNKAWKRSDRRHCLRGVPYVGATASSFPQGGGLELFLDKYGRCLDGLSN